MALGRRLFADLAAIHIAAAELRGLGRGNAMKVALQFLNVFGHANPYFLWQDTTHAAAPRASLNP